MKHGGEIQAQYVSRAGNKLAEAVNKFSVRFTDKVVLDVGSSTGGFTDYSLQNGASKVYAVDIGSHQMHLSLRLDSRVELHEKTDILDFEISRDVDIVLIDVSFVSIRGILDYLHQVCSREVEILAMVKPQFEASRDLLDRNGVIKNDRYRRDVLRDFERWSNNKFRIVNKSDNDTIGKKGNQERFYLLKII